MKKTALITGASSGIELNALKEGENKIYFNSDGKKLAGLLYLPNKFNNSIKTPALVVTRPASGVKEQTAGLYAKELAKRGFITLAFDPKGYGESEGRIRVEDAYSIISDTRNAVTYLASLNYVDTNNIFNVGICLGSAYATVANIEDERIKATATISPILTNPEDMAKTYGSKFILSTMLYSMKPITALLNIFGIQLYLPLAPIKWSDKIYPTTKMQHLALEYYSPGAPGDVPTWKNKVNYYKSETIAVEFNPFTYLEKYNEKPKPYFMAYATGGSRPEKLKEFFDKIDTENKELMIIPNAHHFDLYHKPEHVNKISNGIANFFTKIKK
ncbi:MAG: alpha/beta hydrolase [Flavobacteriaceae bacterium]|nr:alpha/beta hydrolase [Flavobacteriaceae bacterium]